MSEGQQFFFGPPQQVDPETFRRIQEFQQAEIRHAVEARYKIVQWSAVLCTCTRFQFGQGISVPQGGCLVHGGYLAWDAEEERLVF